MNLPPILFAADVAKLMGWSTQRARRWLERTSAGKKRAGRYVTTPAKLAEHFPEAWAELATRGMCADEDAP